MARVRDQARGQALVPGMALLAFVLACGVVLYRTARLTTDKTRLANAADAAAYSGAVWEARTLNLEASLNRAAIANQIAVAQAVSFLSWTEYLDRVAINVDAVLGWIPWLKPYTSAMRSASVEVDRVMAAATNAAVTVLDGVLEAIHTAQSAVHLQAIPATQEIVREVIRRNDPAYQVSVLGNGWLASNALSWMTLTSAVDPVSDGGRMAGVIGDSRDPFSRNRGWQENLANLGVLRVSHAKVGTTELIRNGDIWAWQGVDAWSVHESRLRISRWRKRWVSTELPVGWGGARAGGAHARFDTAPNVRSGGLAHAAIEDVSGYDGVRSYRDLADRRARTPGVDLALELRSGGLASVAKARVEFRRPERRWDRRVEFGSLFNPYWDARLAEAGSERSLSRAAMVLRGAGP